MPHVTLTARKGPIMMGLAQFVLSGPRVRPPFLEYVDKPSLMDGSNFTAGCSCLNPMAPALYSSMVFRNICVFPKPLFFNFSANSVNVGDSIRSTTSGAYSSFLSHAELFESHTWNATLPGCDKIARPNFAYV